MSKEIKIRDLRKKDQYKIDDAYLNGYAKLCGVYATAVYNSLSRHANFHTQECYPSMELLAEQHDISKPSVIKGIRKLVEWGIVEVHMERDEVTKRQMPNVYTLVDKSQWHPRPSRVNDVDPDIHTLSTPSRVNVRSEPSKRQKKSRVNDVDCKDNKEYKDNKVKVSNAERVADPINPLIDLFRGVNPSWGRLFANKTQRAAAERLLKQYGAEKLTALIETLSTSNSNQFAPKITTPLELENKMGLLKAYWDTERAKQNVGRIGIAL